MGRLQCVNGSERTRLFLLMAGIGLDAKIVYNISMPLKARFGKLAYWLGGFSLLGRELDEFEVLVEGRRVNCAFALISKVRNYGGDLEIAQSDQPARRSVRSGAVRGAQFVPVSDIPGARGGAQADGRAGHFADPDRQRVHAGHGRPARLHSGGWRICGTHSGAAWRSCRMRSRC